MAGDRNIICAVIGYLRKTDMKIVSIKMNSKTYVNIVNEQLLKYADSIAKQNFSFRHDNSSMYTTNAMKAYFASQKISRCFVMDRKVPETRHY